MEYLAFGLLGLGAILILLGLLSGRRKNQAPPPVTASAPSQPIETPEKNTFMASPMPQQPKPPAPEVMVGKENPTFFEKEAYLYLDYSPGNVYDGTDHSFRIRETEMIRRYGKGYFTYDGFAFHFKHSRATERFPLESIEHLAFYPNCIALVPKSKQPTALFFVDDTSSIRNILDTFRVEHAS